AGKVASLHGTAGLQIRFSAFIEQEAADSAAPPVATPITPTFVLGSPLDGTSIQPPDVTVNQDTAGAPQNETAIAVDPNNPNHVVAAANDYVSRTWSCTVSGTPCSALGDAYSGTYFSNDGGQTWCCTATDPSHLGTLIPGVEHLTGGPYDAGGDPAVAWDSQGHVYYAGLGFNRTSAPKAISGNVLYSQGSRPVVGPDGALYVFWDGATRLASLDSTWVVKSTDGGATWGKPVQISTLHETEVLGDTAFRVNSFPAAAA